MKNLLFFSTFLFCIPVLAQAQALEMVKIGSEETRVFKEKKRVKVKTIEGEKYIGRFKIVDQNSIEIKENTIPINSISNIKSRSVVAGIAGTLLIITGPFIIAASPKAALVSGSKAGFFVFGTGSGVTLSGIFFNEFARNHRNKKWTYKTKEE